jgi:uncharacterized protein YggE
MRKLFLLGLLLIIAILIKTTPGLAENRTERTITVTGEAEIKVVPDRVILTLGVETSDKSLLIAKNQNDATMKKILRLTKDYQIGSQKVQTDYLNIEPRYNDRYENREFIGYFVRNAVVITIDKVELFEDFLGKALTTGANYVLGIDFQTTELRKHRDEARKLAIRAAKEKAIDLAGELGQKIGKPCKIVEIGNGWYSSYGSAWGRGWRSGMSQNIVQSFGGDSYSGEVTVALGQINVKANVTVTFELE